jgi:D-aminopeptidase
VLDGLFAAVVEATEEAVVNVLCAGETMIGFQGHRSPGMPIDRVLPLLAARGVLVG